MQMVIEMNDIYDENTLSELADRAQSIYETRLKADLEAQHIGDAVAIHVDTGDYATGKTHSKAARLLLTRHPKDGRIVTLRIGPPNESDLQIASRIAADQKL